MASSPSDITTCQSTDSALYQLEIEYPEASYYRTPRGSNADVFRTRQPIRALMPLWASTLYSGIVGRITEIERTHWERIQNDEVLNTSWPRIDEVYNALVNEQRRFYTLLSHDHRALEETTELEFIVTNRTLEMCDDNSPAYVLRWEENQRKRNDRFCGFSRMLASLSGKVKGLWSNLTR